MPSTGLSNAWTNYMTVAAAAGGHPASPPRTEFSTPPNTAAVPAAIQQRTLPQYSTRQGMASADDAMTRQQQRAGQGQRQYSRCRGKAEGNAMGNFTFALEVEPGR